MELHEHPQKPIVIMGFPGFGLIGTITTDFLLEHLSTRKIGNIIFNEMPARVAIHEGEVIDPIGIYYNEKHNIVIVHGLIPTNEIEWQIAGEIQKVLEEMNPYEVINIEGVFAPGKEDQSRVYFYTNNDEKRGRLQELGFEQLDEGIIIGVTSSLLTTLKRDMTSLFAETHTELPDSKGAAKIIEALDKYLGLEVETEPLIEKAKIFEQKLKGIMKNSHQAKKEADRKAMNYVG